MSEMATLAQQQSALLDAIFTTNKIAAKAMNTLASAPESTSNRGLKTYRANAHASALRSLQTAYPVVAQLIGADAFEHLARDFWAQHPPARGDLAQWGGELPGFVARISALQTEPYLGDVARVEWALHTAATAADQTADLATFSRLTEQDPAALTLQLAPGTALLHSDHPVASIVTAHVYGNPPLEEVGQKLRAGGTGHAETAVVWRHGLRPMVASCPAAEALFIGHLLAGKSLLAALEADAPASGTEPLNLQLWLPQAVQSGLVLGVCPA
jgi:Putative DNA-binding domain